MTTDVTRSALLSQAREKADAVHEALCAVFQATNRTSEGEALQDALTAADGVRSTLDVLVNGIAQCQGPGCVQVVSKPARGPMRRFCGATCRQRAHRAGL